MNGATLTNGAGPALVADGVTVDSDAFFDDGFSATGQGDFGAVRLPGGHVGGQLSMNGATLTNGDGPALVADGVTVDDGAFFDGFSATGHGNVGVVRLRDSHIGGRLDVTLGSSWSKKTGMAWEIDGLRYAGFPTPGFDNWLIFLRVGTLSYSPQPYQQLAAVARAAGHDNEARRALMAQRKDQLKRGNLPRGAKAWARFTGFTLGYGYQPWRALLIVAVTLAMAFANIFYFYPQGFAHTENGGPCTATEKAQIAFDVVVPLVRTSIGTLCHTTSTVSGQAAAAINIGLTVLGWAFTALFAAGFTRAIRQP
jgi:hypothetical protein